MPSKPVFEETVAVSLSPWQWAGICSELKHALKGDRLKHYKRSWADSLSALQEIDRVMRGADEPSPPDDLLGGEIA